MKAIRVHQFGEPEVMKLEEVADPKAGAGEVVVGVKAVGVNPVETYIRGGRYPAPPTPYTPGTDAAGVIEAVGEGVHELKVGTRVYTSNTLSGAYAQKALCRVDQVHPLPDHVTFEQGAAMGIPYATAYRALFDRGNAHGGETVLIHGASGGVGIAAVQIARAAGLRVYGTAGTDEGRKLVAKEGAHQVLDHTQPDYLQELMKLTSGKGVDVIVEMLANVNLGKDLTVLAKHGRVVVVGSRGPVEINARETMAREADIRGVMLFAAPPEELRGVHSALVAGLENRTLRPIVGKTMQLADAPKAHREIIEQRAYGKIVLIP